jgi:hypothetical protein
MFQRQGVRMLFGPGGGPGVEGTLQIIALEANHLSHAHDHLSERLSGAPMVANADLLRVDIGMKDRSQHAAKGRPPGIIQRKEDFGLMDGAWHEGIFAAGNQALNVEDEMIPFGR